MPSPLIDSDRIRVCIIDDESDIRLTLGALINETPDLRCTGEYDRCEPLLERLEKGEEHHDVIILDIHLPGISGLDALPRFKKLCPDTAVIFLTGYPTDANIARGLSEKPSGFLSKTSHPQEILAAIRAAKLGVVPIDRLVERKLADQLPPVHCDPRKKYRLTEREKEILKRVCEKPSLKEDGLAKEFNVSYATMHTHLQHIHEKLGVHSHAEMIAKALREHLFS